jgi:hypothetical protein
MFDVLINRIIGYIFDSTYGGLHCDRICFIYETEYYGEKVFTEKYADNYRSLYGNYKAVSVEYFEKNPYKYKDLVLPTKYKSNISIQILYMITDYVDSTYITNMNMNLIKKIADKCIKITRDNKTYSLLKYIEYVINYMLYVYYSKELLTSDIINDTCTLITELDCKTYKIRPYIYVQSVAWKRRSPAVYAWYYA